MTALVVVSAMVVRSQLLPSVAAAVESLERSQFSPVVLAEGGLADRAMDDLRLAGVPVMVHRPNVASNRLARRSHDVAELRHWLRTSDASVVVVWKADVDSVRLVHTVRRFVGSVREVIELSGLAMHARDAER